MANPSQSYGASLAIWDHTVLPATRHKWTRPALIPARQAGTLFTYPGGMEGWVDLGSLIAARPGIEPTTAWSQVRRPNRYTIKPPEAVRISKFIWQRVPDCRASIIKSPAAVRAKSAARHAQRDGSGLQNVDDDGEEQHQRLGWGDLRGTEVPVRADTGTLSHQACTILNRGLGLVTQASALYLVA